MSIPSRAAEAEARKADVAFQIALAQIGAGTFEDAVDLWRAMEPGNAPGVVADWLDQAIHLILGRRRLSRDLAMAYYRLARALRTGTTIRDPFGPAEPEHVTIDALRRQFRLLVEDIDVAHRPGGEPAEPETLEEDAKTDDPADPSDDSDDSQRIPVEDLDGLSKAELDAEERSEETLADELTEAGPNLFRLRIEGLDEDDTDSSPEQENDAAALRTARAARKAALNGGRGSAFLYGSKDERVIAWARVSKSGDPCYFCAMLISRGAVYKSKRSAGFDGSGDLYHDECQCIAVPIYSKSQYETDPRFDQNRALSDLWQEGASLKEWRRYFDGRRRAGDTPWVRPPLDSPTQAAG